MLTFDPFPLIPSCSLTCETLTVGPVEEPVPGSTPPPLVDVLSEFEKLPVEIEVLVPEVRSPPLVVSLGLIEEVVEVRSASPPVVEVWYPVVALGSTAPVEVDVEIVEVEPEVVELPTVEEDVPLVGAPVGYTIEVLVPEVRESDVLPVVVKTVDVPLVKSPPVVVELWAGPVVPTEPVVVPTVLVVVPTAPSVFVLRLVEELSLEEEVEEFVVASPPVVDVPEEDSWPVVSSPVLVDSPAVRSLVVVVRSSVVDWSVVVEGAVSEPVVVPGLTVEPEEVSEPVVTVSPPSSERGARIAELRV